MCSQASAEPPSHASSERVVLPPHEGGRMGEAWHHPQQQQQPMGQQPQQRARSHRPSGVTDDLEEGEEEVVKRWLLGVVLVFLGRRYVCKHELF